MYCNKCGKKVPDESNFCLFCGADLSKYREYLDSSESNENIATKIEDVSDSPSKDLKDKKSNTTSEKVEDNLKKPYKYKRAVKTEDNSHKDDTMVYKREEFLGSYRDLVDENLKDSESLENNKFEKDFKSTSENKWVEYSESKRDYSNNEEKTESSDSDNIKGYSFFEEEEYALPEKNLDALPDFEVEALPKPKKKSSFSFKNLFSKKPSEKNIEDDIDDDFQIREKPDKKENDVILESDYDTSSYLNTQKPHKMEKNSEFILDESNLVSSEDDSETKKEKSDGENVVARFAKYMFEKEEYDTSYLTTRSKSDKAEVDTELDELEEPQIESTLETEEIIPDLNLDKSIDYELFESENEDEENLVDTKEEPSLIKSEEESSKKSAPVESKSEIIYDSKESAKVKNSKKKDSKKTSAQPSIFKNFRDFMYESEDEDDLLELTPSQYSKLKEEVVTNIEPKTVKNFFFGESKKRDDDILEDRIFVEEPEKDLVDSRLELDYDETTADELNDPYKNADKNQNIRFSKKVIDTHQEKIIDKKLENNEKKEKSHENKDLIPEKSKTYEVLNKKPYKSEIIVDEKESSIEESTPEIEVEKISEEERYILKDELEKAFKDEIDSGQIVIEMDDKNDKKKSTVKEFFESIGAFFSSKEKDDDLHSENIEIIVNSPIESEDTMPLKLTREEREVLNKELNKHNRSKTNSTLNNMHEKVKPLIKRLLERGSSFIIPMLIIALIISIFSLTKGVKTVPSAVVLGILKVVILYITLYIATNTSFKSVGIRLKQNVITLFVVIELNLILLLDLIYILISSTASSNLDNLFRTFSPNIVITIVSLVLLGLFIMIANYKKLEERGKVIEFLGWFVVLSITISLIMILIQFLITTLVYSAFPRVVY